MLRSTNKISHNISKKTCGSTSASACITPIIDEYTELCKPVRFNTQVTFHALKRPKFMHSA